MSQPTPAAPAWFSVLTELSTVLNIWKVLNKVLQDLNQMPGIEAWLRDVPTPDLDGRLEIRLEGKQYILAIEARKRAPYPGELSGLFGLRDQLGRWGTPTLVAPRMPESVGKRLVPLGWSWADEQGHYDLRLASGVRLARRESVPRPVPAPSPRTPLPQGRGGLAIVRLLLTASGGVFLRTSDVASETGVTNARASQVMHKLQQRGFVQKESDGWATSRDDLLAAFLAEYRGPGGTELQYYSLDDPETTAAVIVDRVSSSPHRRAAVAISADVGPDLIVPWRRPTKLVVYVDDRGNIDLTDLSEAPDRASANLLIRFPDDKSVFQHVVVDDSAGVDIPLADESQMIWDLYDLGGEDRAEAARHLSEWLTKNR